MWQWCEGGKANGCGCYVDAEDEEVECNAPHSGGPWIGAAWQAPPDGKAGIVDTRIENNFFPKAGVGTRASLSVVSSTPADTWHFDFCDYLVFKQIAIVRGITVTLAGPATGPVSSWAQNLTGCQVTIRTSVPVVGTVFADVDSSTYDASFV